jgi:DNA repair exonuclease SbcCD ATPase subunit
MKQFLVGALTFGTARRLEEQLTRLESDLTAFQKQNEAKSGKADETYAAIIAQLTALESAAAEARNVLAARLDSAMESDIALDGRLAVAEAQSARSTSSLTAVDERLAAIDERLSGVRDATAPIAGRVDAAEAKITTQEAKITTQEAKITTQEAKITTQEGAIAAQTAAVEDLKSTVGSLTQARIERIQPLLLILGLNNAVTANRSYKASLDAAAEALVSVSAALGDATAATAIATLRRHEGDSIPTRDQITRDFGAISQSVLLEQEPSRIESLRVSIVALVEAALDKPTSAVSEQDRIKSMLRTIGAELSGGRLGEALTKAESLDHPKFRTKLNAWRAQARARLEVDAAVEALEAMAFKYLSAER